MSIIEAIILGATQGITEFVPVSSTGHVILAEKFLGLSTNFTFGILLNIGTLLALLVFFRKMLLEVAGRIVRKRDLKLAAKIVLAITPTFIIGFLLSDFFDSLGTHTWVVVAALLIFGLLMIRVGGEEDEIRVRDETKATTKDVFWIGMSQVLALVPGVSRSGSTILAGLNRGFSSSAAANFSFLMAFPTILGAVVHTLIFRDGIQFISDNTAVFVVGNIASFLTGAVGVKLLLGLMKKHGLRPFGWYRIGLGGLLAVLLVTKVL